VREHIPVNIWHITNFASFNHSYRCQRDKIYLFTLNAPNCIQLFQEKHEKILVVGSAPRTLSPGKWMKGRGQGKGEEGKGSQGRETEERECREESAGE
jgi:hypothetical protein